MTSRKLLVLEIETEEVAIATLLHALEQTDWQVTILGSRLLLDRLADVLGDASFDGITLDAKETLFDFEWESFDLILLPNPKFMPADYAEAFLSSRGSTPFGIGVFDLEDLNSRGSAINRCYRDGNSFFICCSFVYISDLDFVNRDNQLARKVGSMNKKLLVIPFKHTTDVQRCLSESSINIVVSGKVQAKRRNYLFAIIGVFRASQNSPKPVHLCLNGGATGIYGIFIYYFTKLAGKVSRNLSIEAYKSRVNEDRYRENLRKSHINLLPLTSLYDDGKDSGAFYDSMQYNMVSICPDSHLRSIGSVHGAVALGYSDMEELVSTLCTVMPRLNGYLAQSYTKTKEYCLLDFCGYLVNELNTLSKNR